MRGVLEVGPDRPQSDKRVDLARVSAGVSTGMALVLLIGGGYAAVLMGFGISVFAAESYPLAFGIDLWGDRSYRFPEGPLPALRGLVVLAAGVSFGFVLLRAAQREAWARWTAVAGFLVAIGVAGVLAIGASVERRCAAIEYSQVDRCMPRTVAAARDFIPLGLPAVIAAALLVREPS